MVGSDGTSNVGALVFSAATFAVSFALVLGTSCLVAGLVSAWGIAAALVVAVLVAMSAHIAQEWERVVILRYGRFNRVAGPGLFFIVPVLDSIAVRVDSRVRVTTFGAEETLTSDLVPPYVDAALFWVVFDPKAACTEVGDFTHAVEMAAQTALRDVIGRGGVAEVAIRREQLDRELKRALE